MVPTDAAPTEIELDRPLTNGPRTLHDVDMDETDEIGFHVFEYVHVFSVITSLLYCLICQ